MNSLCSNACAWRLIDLHVYVCASMDLCLHVLSPPFLSATRMSVFHMCVSSDHSVKRRGIEEEEGESVWRLPFMSTSVYG